MHCVKNYNVILNRTSSTMHTSYCTPVRLVMWKFSSFCGQTFFISPFFLCFEHWRHRWAIRERGSDANLCLIPPAPPVEYLPSFSHWTPLYISTSSDREYNIQMKKNRCACSHDFVIVSCPCLIWAMHACRCMCRHGASNRHPRTSTETIQ
jgi:hypothetical protein